MRVLALGSCRILDPLAAAADAGEVECLNRRFRRKQPIFLHDIHEALQFVRLVRGDVALPETIRRFAYNGGLRVHRDMLEAMHDAGRVVVELCTDKHYEADGWTLNVNELHRLLVQAGGPAARDWWDVIDRGQSSSADLVLAVEKELRARTWIPGRVDEGHRVMLRRLAFRHLGAEEIAHGLKALAALLPAPILVMPHVAVRLPGGAYLAERLQHVEKVIAAARMVGVPCLDPRAFVDRDGQDRALADGGLDYNHYASTYLPIAGREIVQALERLSPTD